MTDRVEYTMTQEDCDTLLEAMKPTPMIMLQCGTPPSQQERANIAWAVLGKKMGFDPTTPRPIQGRSMLHFTAVPEGPTT